MNVFVELDADPPRLRRDDGLIVRFPRAENGTYPVIEIGWMKNASQDDLPRPPGEVASLRVGGGSAHGAPLSDPHPPRRRPPPAAGGGVNAGSDATEGFEMIFQWTGVAHQELQSGSKAALLVGHVPGGGYCSAAVTMDARSVTLEFADRVPADKNGLQRVSTEFFVHDSCDVVVSVGDETSFSADVDDAPGGSLHRLRVERDKANVAVETQLRVSISR